MALEQEELKRVFKHDKKTLTDPDPNMSPDDVLDFYSNQFSELTNATVKGPEIENDELVFTFSTSVGTKG